MKSKSNTYWTISAISLSVAALWGAISQLSDAVGTDTISGIALVVFGIVSVVAAFSFGIRSTGSGWLVMEGIISVCMGLSYIFTYVDYALFTVDLVLIMGLWLLFLGISQVTRVSKKARCFGRGVALAMGVVAVFGGLALYINPVTNLMQISAGGRLQVYSSTFQFMIAALTVASRLLLKDAKK